MNREHSAIVSFLEAEISAGKAAEILGISKAAFIELLNQRNLPYLDADLQELEREVAAAEAALSARG